MTHDSTSARRMFLAGAGAALLAGCAAPRPPAGASGGSLSTTMPDGDAACGVATKARQAAVSPDQVIEMLKRGNERFVAGRMRQCDYRDEVKATATQQAPLAVVVGCIDSRSPPEVIFDQRIGDIFAARVAGNFVNDDILGSLEFATRIAGAKAIVVLGHSECGAIKGAIDDAKLGHLTGALAKIRPSVIKIRDVSGAQDSKNKKLVQAVADQNARDAAAAIAARSDVMRELIDQGKLKVVAAMHDLSTGRVSWFG